MSGRWDDNKTFAELTDPPASHTDTKHSDGPNAKDPHGFAQHTNRTRYIDVTPVMMSLDSGVLGSIGAVPQAMPRLAMADAATQGGYFSCRIPVDAVAGQPLNIIIEHSVSPGVTGHASWSVNVVVIAPGGTVSQAGTTVAWLGDDGVKTANALNVESAHQVLASVNADDVVRLDLRRIGGDANDTLDGSSVALHRIRLAYTAEQ